MSSRDILRSIAAAAAALWRSVKRAAEELVLAAAFLGGLALVAYGAWLVYAPFGFLFAGAVLLAGVLLYVWRRPGTRGEREFRRGRA